MTARPEGPAAPNGRRLPLSHQIARSLRLAVPVMLSRAGLIVMISVDSIMTGRAGAEELAYYAISLAPHMTLVVVGIGLLVGTVVLSAQADGAGRSGEVGTIWLSALWIAGALGLVWALVLLPGEGVLRLLGQNPSVAEGGGRALVMFAFGMPAILMYVATMFCLEGIGRPGVGVAVALGANLLNAALNWALVYGHLGAPEMGAAGAALATTITRWAMVLALAAYALALPGGAAYGLGRAARARFATARRLLRLGAPLSLATGLETACFATLAAFAGRLGEVPLASYQIAFNVVAFVFMLAIGLSTAISVHVAQAVGRRDRQGVAQAGWTGLGLAAVLMALIAGLIRLFDQEIARLYSLDPAVLALAVPALGVAAAVVLVDGTQAVVLGALRGAGDALVPALSHGVSFWAVAVPLAYLFGLEGQAGILGLLWGAFAGLLCALVLLAWRFALVSRRAVRPL